MALCRAMGAGEDQEELLLPLIEATQAALALRLKDGVSPEDCGQAFSLAVAMMAMEGLEETAGSDREISSFTAGEVTVHRETENGPEKRRSARAERLMAPWLKDGSFCFRGVRG